MGGYNGGEVASKLAVVAASNYIENNFNDVKDDKEKILNLIKSAMEYANMIVLEKARENENLEQMGTTLEICLIYMNKAFIGHIGDSRTYRIRKNIIRRITTDHSYVQELVKDGKITKQEAEAHPKKNMLMKALGCETFAEPDVLYKNFLQDDIILLCSDGLTNMLKEDEIYDIIKENEFNPEEELIRKANELGGYDNITAVIIKN